MATAKKLPSGNWRVRLYIGENSNGKKLYKSFTARTKKEAEFLAAEYNLKRKGKPKDLTIGDAIDGYIANKDGVLSPSTIAGYRNIRKNQLQELMNVPLSKITNLMVQAAINEAAKTLSAKSVRNAHGLLTASVAMYMPDFVFQTTLPAKEHKVKDLPTPQQIADAIKAEMERQNSHIELIASENWVSKAVMAAMGSPLTNKYAEGYPGKRYYGGCQCVDVVEDLARERAKKLFGCEYVNVQPHSGAQANMAVMFAMLEPGDKIMGMNLDHGGHLTHGSPVNMSGKYFDVAHYGVNEDGVIDYDEVLRIAKEHQPKLIVAGASAYARTIDFKRFREIADEVGAYLMVDIAHIAGLVATGLHPSPIPYAHVTTTTTHKTLRGPRGGMIMCSEEMNKKFNFNKAVFPGIQGGPLMHVIAGKAVCFKEALQPEYKTYMEQVVRNAKALCNGLKSRGVKIVSGDTDNHLMLVDLSGTDISGKELEKRLDDAHVTANKNTIPNDPRSPFVTSGVRLGTPAVTTRGMKEEDMDKIAEIIAMVIESEDNVEKAKAMVAELTAKYPLC